MRHPAYHLRPNKAVDRLALIEALRLFGKNRDLSNYTYYGMGGPYLEDFRLLYEHYPELKFSSIEVNEDTVRRQRFHLPCGRIKLIHDDLSSFLVSFESNDAPFIFWLDYTDLTFGCFSDFMMLLGKSTEESMLKVTLRAHPRDFYDNEKEFRDQFDAVLPNSDATVPREESRFAALLQSMVRIAAENALPAASECTFQPVSSFWYSDSKGMLTITGIVCRRANAAAIRNEFKGWKLLNTKWSWPRKIDVPTLSTKERMHVQGMLPCKGDAGRQLAARLGYSIGDSAKENRERLEQYAAFHRYAPYFMRGIP